MSETADIVLAVLLPVSLVIVAMLHYSHKQELLKPPPCDHKWVLIKKTVCPGYNTKNVWGMGVYEISTLIEASRPRTGFLFQCSLCTAVRTETLVGVQTTEKTREPIP